MRAVVWEEGYWTVLREPDCPHFYYHNKKTGETTWLAPPELVAASRERRILSKTADWEVVQDSRKKPYYYHRHKHYSTWDPPASLKERQAGAEKEGKLLLVAVAGLAQRKYAEEEGDGTNIPPDTTPQVRAILSRMGDEKVDSVGVWECVDENQRNAFMGVCALGMQKLALEMLKHNPPLEKRDKDGYTALALMALAGDTTGIQDIMAAGGDVTTKSNDGFYIWEAALDAGFGAVSKVIKEKHMVINQALVAEKKAMKEKSRNMKFETIWEAAEIGHSGQIQWHLVSSPELLNAFGPDGLTLLMIVGRRGFWLAADALVRAGAEVDVKDQRGWSACMHAASCNQISAVSYLLSAGADPRIAASNGLTALQLTSCPQVVFTLEGAIIALTQAPPPPSPSRACSSKVAFSAFLSVSGPALRPSLLSQRGPKPRTSRGVLFTEEKPVVHNYDNGPEEGEEEGSLPRAVAPDVPLSPMKTHPPAHSSSSNSPPPPPPPPEDNLPAKIKTERKPIAPPPAPKKKAAKF